MRKLLALLLALMMFCSAAMAEENENLIALDYEHFVIAIPKDAMGNATNTIENNVPFLVVYQDYDPNAVFCSSLNVVWNQDVLKMDEATPEAFAQEALSYAALQHSLVGVEITNPKVLVAEYDELDDQRALSFVVSMDMDYSPLGLDYQGTLYTLQAVVPVEGVGTYTFTIGTDDLENAQMLTEIVDSVRWK